MKPIGEAQTETGVKDKTMNVAISQLLEEFHQERQKKDGRSKDDIAKSLATKVPLLRSQLMNPLLTMPGAFLRC